MTNITELTISKTLKELGVTPALAGYSALRYALKLAIDSPSILRSLTGVLYPKVAEHLGTTAFRVERIIRHAIEVAWLNGDLDVQQEIFGYTVKISKGKPTNKEFIATVTDYLLLIEGGSHGD